jgi:MFS family permease
MSSTFSKDLQYYRFCLYGFFKNLRFFEAFLLLFFLEKGLSFFSIGMLYAVREITVNIFEVPSGVIADAFGRRRTMILAFLFYIASFVVFFFGNSYGVLLLAMMLFSLGEAFRSGNNKAMIFHYLSLKGWAGQKVHYYGNTRSWSQMGSALSALSGAAIVFISGSYRYIFLFSVIPYILDLMLVASYPRVLDGKHHEFRWSKIRENFRQVFRALLEALKSLLVLRIIGSLSVYSGYYKAVKDYLQAVVAAWAVIIPLMTGLDDEQRSSVMIGLVFFVVYVLSSAASRASGRFSERFGTLSAPMNLTIFAGLIFGLFSGIFYLNESWVLSVVLFIMVYMIENIRKPVGVAYLGSSIDGGVLASVLSVDSQMKSLVAAILAPIFGIFADLYGVGWSIVIVSAGLLVIAPLMTIKSEKQ